MVKLDFVNNCYEVVIVLPRNSFNEELLKKLCGLTYRDKMCVSSTIKSKLLPELLPTVEKFLTLKQLLKL